MPDAKPRFEKHVSAGFWRGFERGKCGERLEEKHFRPALTGHLFEQSHHRVHADARARDEWDEEVGEAEVRAVDALLGDRRVSSEFLGDGRSVRVARVERLRAAVGLNAGEEKIAALPADYAL